MPKVSATYASRTLLPMLDRARQHEPVRIQRNDEKVAVDPDQRKEYERIRSISGQ